MRPALFLIPLLLVAAPAAESQRRTQPIQQRCGWLVNPTPANFWLVDRHGEWIMAAQGGYQAPGMDDLPDMNAGGWVRTNGNYGYGCACMRVTTDNRLRRITRIVSARPVPLAQCRRDRNLPGAPG